jgi:prolipoprotein diacylglyceryltransferase
MLLLISLTLPFRIRLLQFENGYIRFIKFQMRINRPSKSIGIVFCIALVAFGTLRLFMTPDKTTGNVISHVAPSYLTTSLLIIGALGLIVMMVLTFMKSGK